MGYELIGKLAEGIRSSKTKTYHFRENHLKKTSCVVLYNLILVSGKHLKI
jgi:hypothetical protein